MSNDKPLEVLDQMVKCLSQAMALMDLFQDSRSGQIAFQKLEESLMWLQVMAHNVPLKEITDETANQIIDTEESLLVG